MIPDNCDLLVIGGGAAGFFGAVTAAETARELGRRIRVVLLEASPQTLSKVRISGGGRCNVTHHCFEPAELITRYPRGGRELRGPLSRFGPTQTIEWFKQRGVALKTESDGRMFPVTDRSSTIIDALRRAAEDSEVEVHTRQSVSALALLPSAAFEATLQNTQRVRAERVLIATGGMRADAPLLSGLGHQLLPPVPSLFSFHCRDPRFQDLAGLAVASVRLSIPGQKPGLSASGPMLFTHEGMSGPAVLRLSAWGARQMAAWSYRFPLAVSFLGNQPPESALETLNTLRRTHGKKALHTWCPFEVPLRLWEKLITASGASRELTWASAPRTTLSALADLLTQALLQVDGKSLNKDEFVTCGGVALEEVDFRTMESRRTRGLHFAGEVLDIDGITGGFNFQAAWTTGWHAGRAVAHALCHAA